MRHHVEWAQHYPPLGVRYAERGLLHEAADGTHYHYRYVLQAVGELWVLAVTCNNEIIFRRQSAHKIPESLASQVVLEHLDKVDPLPPDPVETIRGKLGAWK